jgi:hypothetical protein
MSMPPYGIKPGRRKAGPHRCDSVLHAVGWTVLSGVAPGAGFLHGRRTRLGAVVLLVAILGLVWAAFAAPHNLNSALDLAFDPSRLTRAAIVTAVCLVLWVAVVVGTFVVLRPSPSCPPLATHGGQRVRGCHVPGRDRPRDFARPRRHGPGGRREQGLHPPSAFRGT